MNTYDHGRYPCCTPPRGAVRAKQLELKSSTQGSDDEDDELQAGNVLEEVHLGNTLRYKSCCLLEYLTRGDTCPYVEAVSLSVA